MYITCDSTLRDLNINCRGGQTTVYITLVYTNYIHAQNMYMCHLLHTPQMTHMNAHVNAAFIHNCPKD